MRPFRGFLELPPKPAVVYDSEGRRWIVTATTNGNPRLTLEDMSMSAVAVTNLDREQDRVPDMPRMRRSLLPTSGTSLTLTNSWQQLRFRKKTTWDGDTFDTSGVGPRYDETTDRLIAGPGDATKQYHCEIHWDFDQATLLTGLLPTRFQFRFHVPRPANLGGSIYFPFPTKGSAGGVDLATATTNEPSSGVFVQRLYFESNVRAYGIRLEARVNGLLPTTLRTVRLTEHTAVLLYPC